MAEGRISPRISNIEDRDEVFYTRKGVVAGTRTRGRYKLLSLEGNVIKTFYITQDEETPFDFDIDGEYYYIFDQQNMRLYKARTGF